MFTKRTLRSSRFSPAPHRRGHLLNLERLEDRRTPSVGNLRVTSVWTANDADCNAENSVVTVRPGAEIVTNIAYDSTREYVTTANASLDLSSDPGVLMGAPLSSGANQTGCVSFVVPMDTAPGVYNLYVYAHNRPAEGKFDVGPGDAVVWAAEAHVLPTTKVESVTFGDGRAQRSMVKQIVVDFTEPVNFTGSAASAFTLRCTGASDDVELSAEPATGPASRVTLTFPSNRVGSLDDGCYNFAISAAQISGEDNGALDGNNDGIPGGDYQVVGSRENGFFRLCYDADGDGVVSQGYDILALRNAFGTTDPAFDFFGDGVVGQDDCLEFRNHFGMRV